MASDSFGGFTNTLAAYYGIARVALDHLWFDETAPDARTVDPDNVIRLLRMFEDGQCDRLAADHYMSATISTEIMARALERGNLSRESLQSPEPAFLPLEGDERVIGIRGIHRYKAAQQYFTDSRWWVIRLYDECVLTDAARRNLAWSGVMLTSVPSGEVYRRIRLAHHNRDWDWKTAWEHCVRPAYLKGDIVRLQEGTEHEALRDALDQLLRFPGLWMDLQMPPFHGLSAVNCMESLVAFLHVVNARLSTVLGDLDPQHLDVRTIRSLQGRCPALSTSDREEIESLLKQNWIFPHVIDQQERARLKQRLLAQDTIIPSLKSWKDAIARYLKPGASILNPLFCRSSHKHRARSQRVRLSIQQEARASFRPARGPRTQSASDPVNHHFWDVYRKLWVAAMGHLLDVESGDCSDSIQYMAQVAYALGFSSETIRRHICDDELVPADTRPGSGPMVTHPSPRPIRIRFPSIPSYFRNLRTSRDRFTVDEIYSKTTAAQTETLTEFEVFRDAFRSFFPILPPIIGPFTAHGRSKPQSAMCEETSFNITAWIEELNHANRDGNPSTTRGPSHLLPPLSWSTDSGSCYSREISGEARSSTEAVASRLSAGPWHTRLLHQSQYDARTGSEPAVGLLGVECRQVPQFVQQAMYDAKGTWIYHATSQPMIYKLPPIRSHRIFRHAIVHRGTDYRYAIFDENGVYEEISSDRALELLGTRLIIYGEWHRPDSTQDDE
ncbi:hypothetical protein ZTR_10836, partial [Talaromyces verruculosus]